MPNLFKATFCQVNSDGTLGEIIPVEFNPTEYTLSKGAQISEVTIPGLDTPILQFIRGQTESLSLDLFFDTTEAGMDDNAVSVTTLTDQFYKLVKINGNLHAPPVCLFSWGAIFPGQFTNLEPRTGCPQRYNFKCLVESVRQRFTLFSSLGVPLRATLTVSLKEYKTLSEQINEMNLQSADQTETHVIQEGETLSQIAAGAFNDPTQWRAIADANNLNDPLNLTPGMVLTVPSLTS